VFEDTIKNDRTLMSSPRGPSQPEGSNVVVASMIKLSSTKRSGVSCCPRTR
jgi:hypothetical protein